MKIKFFIAVLISVVTFFLMPPTSANSQTGGSYICGQWTLAPEFPARTSGWWFSVWPFDSQPTAWNMKSAPAGWDTQMNGAYTKIRNPIMQLYWDIAPMVEGFEQYQVVPNCDPVVNL